MLTEYRQHDLFIFPAKNSFWAILARCDFDWKKAHWIWTANWSEAAKKRLNKGRRYRRMMQRRRDR